MGVNEDDATLTVGFELDDTDIRHDLRELRSIIQDTFRQPVFTGVAAGGQPGGGGGAPITFEPGGGAGGGGNAPNIFIQGQIEGVETGRGGEYEQVTGPRFVAMNIVQPGGGNVVDTGMGHISMGSSVEDWLNWMRSMSQDRTVFQNIALYPDRLRRVVTSINAVQSLVNKGIISSQQSISSIKDTEIAGEGGTVKLSSVQSGMMGFIDDMNYASTTIGRDVGFSTKIDANYHAIVGRVGVYAEQMYESLGHRGTKQFMSDVFSEFMGMTEVVQERPTGTSIVDVFAKLQTEQGLYYKEVEAKTGAKGELGKSTAEQVLAQLSDMVTMFYGDLPRGSQLPMGQRVKAFLVTYKSRAELTGPGQKVLDELWPGVAREIARNAGFGVPPPEILEWRNMLNIFTIEDLVTPETREWIFENFTDERSMRDITQTAMIMGMFSSDNIQKYVGMMGRQAVGGFGVANLVGKVGEAINFERAVAGLGRLRSEDARIQAESRIVQQFGIENIAGLLPSLPEEGMLNPAGFPATPGSAGFNMVAYRVSRSYLVDAFKQIWVTSSETTSDHRIKKIFRELRSYFPQMGNEINDIERLFEELRPDNPMSSTQRNASRQSFSNALDRWAVHGQTSIALLEIGGPTSLAEQEDFQAMFQDTGEWHTRKSASDLLRLATGYNRRTGMGGRRGNELSMLAEMTGFMGDTSDRYSTNRNLMRESLDMSYMVYTNELIQMGFEGTGFVSTNLDEEVSETFNRWKKNIKDEDPGVYQLLFGNVQRGVTGVIEKVKDYFYVSTDDTVKSLINISANITDRGRGDIEERKAKYQTIASQITSMPQLTGILSYYNAMASSSDDMPIEDNSHFAKWGTSAREVGVTMTQVAKLVRERIGSDQDVDKDIFSNINLLRDKVLSVGVGTSLSVWYPLNSGG